MLLGLARNALERPEMEAIQVKHWIITGEKDTKHTCNWLMLLKRYFVWKNPLQHKAWCLFYLLSSPQDDSFAFLWR